MPLATFFNSPIKTAAELMKSEEVVRHAIETLKEILPEDEVPSIGQVKAGIQTQEVKDTDVLAVKYAAPTTKRAKEILSAVVQGFLWLNKTQSSGSATRSREFLEVQKTQAQQKLTQIQSRLKQFRREEGITDVSKRVDALIEAFHNAETMVEDCKSEVLSLRELLRFHSNRPQDKMVFAPHADAIFSKLNQDIGEAQLQEIALAGKLKPEHPTMVTLRERIAVLKQTQADRLKQLEVQEPVPMNVRAKSARQDATEKSVDQLQAELAAWQSKLDSAVARRERVQAELRSIPSKQVDYAELVRGEQAALERLGQLEKNYQDACLVESVASGVTNIQIIDQPSVSDAPSGPGKTVLTAIAGVGALIVGGISVVLFLLLDPRAVSLPKILAAANYPVYGSCSGLLDPEDLSEDSAAYERLRLSLAASDAGQTICLMSADENVGKTAIACGLGASYSNNNQRVLLLDISGDGGLRTALENLLQRSLGSSLRIDSHSIDGINIDWLNQNVGLIDGKNNRELILNNWNAGAAATVLKVASQNSDVTIIDTEALSASSKALSLVSLKSFPLVVLRFRATPLESIRFMAGELKLLRVESAGLVITGGLENAVSQAQRLKAASEPTVSMQEPAAAGSVWS